MKPRCSLDIELYSRKSILIAVLYRSEIDFKCVENESNVIASLVLILAVSKIEFYVDYVRTFFVAQSEFRKFATESLKRKNKSEN